MVTYYSVSTLIYIIHVRPNPIPHSCENINWDNYNLSLISIMSILYLLYEKRKSVTDDYP